MISFYNNLKLKHEKYETFLIALFINIPFINSLISNSINIKNFKLLSLLYLIITLLLIIDFIIFNHDRIKMSKIDAILLFVLSFSYVYSFLKNESSINIQFFIIYTLIPLFIISKFTIKGKNIIISSIYIAFFGIPLMLMIINKTQNYISMGLSYDILFPIIASFGYLILYDNKSKMLSICSLCNLIYLVLLFMYGSRGPLLSAVLALFIFFISRKSILTGKDNMIKPKFFASIILVFFMILFSYQILIFASGLFEHLGVRIEFLEKTIFLLKSGGIDNGRNIITSAFFNNFIDAPFFGHGIQSFIFYTGYNYPHNFIYQFLFDIGIVGSCCFLLPFSFNIFNLIKNKNKYENFIFLLFLLFATIPGALLSKDLWLNPLLWLTLSLVIRLDFRN